MSLVVHRARRADELVPGLAALLRDPLPDPFEQELVLVPARGVERWLSQRLSHLLGHGEGREDGVCAGVGFRSPASLVAEITGTREHDPWSPDALVWPLLAVVDDHAGEAWCRVLSQHLGHGEVGEEGELRRGRRYAVARRLAQLFASYAVQRPLLLSAWESGDDSDGAGGALDPDLAWQPELWRLLVAQVDAPSPHARHLARARGAEGAAAGDRPAGAVLPVRPHPHPDDGGRAARRARRAPRRPCVAAAPVAGPLGRARRPGHRGAAQRGRLARARRPPAAGLARP